MEVVVRVNPDKRLHGTVIRRNEQTVVVQLIDGDQPGKRIRRKFVDVEEVRK